MVKSIYGYSFLILVIVRKRFYDVVYLKYKYEGLLGTYIVDIQQMFKTLE